MTQSKILAFAGSTRTGSYNKKLVKLGVEAARKAGAEVTLIDLRDFPMPLYDGDLEERDGLPPNAVKLRKLFMEHQGLLLSCPEYNSSISGVLKNTIDWVSRPDPDKPDEKPLICFSGKIVALLSASPGALGGLRGLVTVRSILGNLQGRRGLRRRRGLEGRQAAGGDGEDREDLGGNGSEAFLNLQSDGDDGHLVRDVRGLALFVLILCLRRIEAGQDREGAGASSEF
jgi:chromate reductase